MTDHETLQALYSKLRAVEWVEHGTKKRLSLHQGSWWEEELRETYCDCSVAKVWWQEKKLASHIAECLCIRETYRQLRVKWHQINIYVTKKAYRIELVSLEPEYNDHVPEYTGSTELEAVWTAAQGEL